MYSVENKNRLQVRAVREKTRFATEAYFLYDGRANRSFDKEMSRLQTIDML
jgi:hypothetical protein